MPGAISPPRPDQVVGPGAAGDVETVELPSGTLLLGRYRVDAVLGRGGFGITYRARDVRLGRDVAVKELFPPAAARSGSTVVVAESNRREFDEARSRFQREAAALARFNHPGIVRIFEVFEANQTAYLVMELIEGASVGELLRGRGSPFGVAEVLDLVLRVGDALGVVHDAGLLHRDVNPSNVMVDRGRRVVLIDFGLARQYGVDTSGSVTRAVTPGYAPPEQYAGSASSGPPCDVFGLAATAYKLVTGATPTNVFDRQAGALLPAPIDVCPGIPQMVSAAILDGMELDPNHRPATARAFLDRLGLFDVKPDQRVLIADPDAAPVAGWPLASAVAGGPGHPGPVRPDPHQRGIGNLEAAGGHMPARAGAMAADAVPGASVASPVAAWAPHPVPSAPGPLAPISPGPVGPVPSAPWHDGSPPVVGPASRRRGWVTWPLGIAAVVLASASPVIVATILALGILPAFATLGDVEVHRYRQRIGGRRRRWHEARVSVVVPVRFVRNLVVAMARALPGVAVAAIGVATNQVFAEGPAGDLARDVTIRVTGVVTALVLLVPARHGGRGYRTDLGISTWCDRVMEGRERPGSKTLVFWVLAVAAVALGAWLDPELWPFT